MLNPNQIVTRTVLDEIASSGTGGVAGVELDNLLKSIDNGLKTPLRMTRTGNYEITIGPIVATNPIVDNANVPAASGAGNDRNKTVGPIGKEQLIPISFAGSTITIPALNSTLAATGITQSTGGGSLLITLTDTHFVRVGVSMNNIGQVILTAGTSHATEASATAPSVPKYTLPIGHFVIHRTGTAIDVLENDNLYSYGSGAGGGSIADTEVAFTAADLTITTTDGYRYVNVNTSSGIITISLPLASLSNERVITFNIVSGTNALRIDPDNTNQINNYGSGDYIEIQEHYNPITFYCNGVAWFVDNFLAINSTKNVSANITVLLTDNVRNINMTTGGTNRTVTIPNASSLNGRRIFVSKQDAGVGFVVISPSSGNINGVSTYTLYTQYESVDLISNGTSWNTVGSGSGGVVSFAKSFVSM